MTLIRPISALALVCAGVVAAQDKPAAVRVAPKAAIDAALAKARSHNKRALVVFASDGSASEVLAKSMKGKALSHLLLYEFAVARVDAADAAADAMAFDFEAAIEQPPAILVLDADRKPLAKLTAADLFTGETLDAEALAKKLGELKAEPVDGDAVLAAGKATAKKSNRRLFVRFDAPW